MNNDAPDVTPPKTSFVTQLDARQRAMLAEMGVRIWAPKPVPAPVSEAENPTALVLATASPPAPTAPDPLPSRAVPPPNHSRPALKVPAWALKPLPEGISSMDWAALQSAVSGCTACGLCQRRKNAVLGAGDVQASWMVVGEAPSQAEDAQGHPFLGPEGELLDNMLRAVGLSREKGAYVTSVVKCRPPTNRNPNGEELAQCSAYLEREVALVQPKVIVAMGRFAMEVLAQSQDHLGRLRGRAHAFKGVPVIATYHPNALLRTQADKAKAWADLCLAMSVVERGTAPVEV